MKNYHFLLLLFLAACGDSDSSPLPDLKAPSGLEVRDISNFGDGRDLQLGFTPPTDLTLIKSFRAYVVKSENAVDFDSLSAASVSQHFLAIDTAVGFTTVIFTAKSKDVDGDLLTEGQAYNLFVSSVGTENNGSPLSSTSVNITLEQVSAVRTITEVINAGSGGMDIDADGNIYMGDFGATLDAGGTSIYKITPSGEVSVFNNAMNGASGNDFDKEGNLYQSSTAGYMSKITPAGVASTFASGFTGGLIGVSVQDDGRLYTCNCGGNLINEVSAEGVISIYVANDLFNCPNGIDVDEEGNLYVANFGNGDVVKVTPDKEVSVFATIPGGNNGHLLIHKDFIYVVARRGNAIYKVDFNGTVVRFAGSGTRGTANGGLSQATFSLPNDIAISADGKKMYVNDVEGSNPDERIISPVVIREIDIIE
ncbi:MAG: hypothetical protein ABJF11_05680 [Reichenbachiella sp.]|uniref:hypothetical protein n=1 Tax=Reichenbachiella sp. TaxID=2184521 RepID=UPI003267DFFC